MEARTAEPVKKEKAIEKTKSVKILGERRWLALKSSLNADVARSGLGV